MGNGVVLSAAGCFLRILCVAMTALFATGGQGRAADVATAPMRAYCSVPPLPGLGVKPNLLLLLDNSASTYDLAYTAPDTFCLDEGFNPAGSYPGYFDQGTLYRYAAGNDRFEAFSGSIAASACGQARTEYLCVNLNNKKSDNFIATGRFLNWLTMSKLDLQKLALTGGKYDTTKGLLQAESRGCLGKRYVKLVKDAAGRLLPVTFGVRGPIPSESGYVSQANHGGPTRIDIYPAVYNKDACLAAIDAWRQGTDTPDKLGLKAAACLGALYDADMVPTPGKVYTEAMSYCYSYLNGKEIAFADLADTLVSDCANRYSWVYGDDPARLVKNTGDDVCAKGLYHNLLYHGGVGSSSGYLGQCYGEDGFDADCVTKQIEDFCSEIECPWLSDPSTSANQAGTNASLPAFVLEAGIFNLGAAVATAQVRVAAQGTPVGLVQQFADDINFGAMIFNDNGAGSECGDKIPCVRHCRNVSPPRSECYTDKDCPDRAAGSCVEDTRNDGGRIISYLNHSPVGDHTGLPAGDPGLVAAVDSVRGTSWTPLAEALYEVIGYFANDTSYRFQSDDFDPSYPPSKYNCQKNNVLIITDGMSSADRAAAVNNFVAVAAGRWVNGADGMTAGMTTTNSTPATSPPVDYGSYNLDDVAWVARNKNIFDAERPITRNNEYITTHVIYTGTPCGRYKGDGSCDTDDEAVPEKMMQLTAAKGGGSIISVKDPSLLQGALKGVLMQVRGGSNAGSGNSILATGEGNGALFLRAQFYPDKSFDGGKTSASWIGEMESLWYYIDPLVGTDGSASGIREDTPGLKVLDLKQDRVVRYRLDPVLQEARAQLFRDDDGDGNADVAQPRGYPLDVAPEGVQALWRAGLQLWLKDATERTVYTQLDGQTLVPFLDAAPEANRQLLLAADRPEAQQTVSFVKGIDDPEGIPPTRMRSLKAYGYDSERVWKLGDIISWTPVLQSAVPLGGYHLPPPAGYADPSYRAFINTEGYKNRGTVYVGANDGMLHAFRLGRLAVRPEGDETWPGTRKAVLVGEKVGEEEWGFVPAGALPYLRYLKEPLYRHLYYVDGGGTLIDASLGDPARCDRGSYWDGLKDNLSGSNWRTVLIGGMGLGGASRYPGSPCVDEGDSATCVKAPAAGVGGLSSYFALDVTEPAAPRLLWEFSHAKLGFATSGAAIVRIKARTKQGEATIHDDAKNGHWFAVFASGPTGAVDRVGQRFTGVSDQNLKLFVLELNAVAPWREDVNYWIIDTHVANAFGGSMAGAGIDVDKWDVSADGRKDGNYEDDALYVGYTRLSDGGRGWTGGVLRLLTGGDPDPANWKTSPVIDDAGPVTGAVAKLQDRQYHRLWLYFGSGRYFHDRDDLTEGRSLFGVSEPCYKRDDKTLRDDGVCTAKPLHASDLTDVTDPAQVVLPQDQGDDYKGWRISLDPAAGSLGSERVVSGPTSLTGGAVFFPTYKPPTLDPCVDGISYLWGVHYSTGGAPRNVAGKAVVPLSNGSIADLSLSGSTDRGGRRGPSFDGRGVKPRLVTNSGLKPLKRIIHIQER